MTEKSLDKILAYREENLSKWRGVLNEIFPKGIPESCIWSSFLEIVSAFNAVGKEGNICHMFFPNKGGLDLTGAESAEEDGCMKILTESTSKIVKPSRLIFQSFPGKDVEWAYFYLEISELKSVSESLDDKGYEHLTLLPNGEYDDADVYEYFDQDENPELIGCESITRFSKGSFVVFAKTSTYNRNPDTYDARHDKMDAEEFRQYISDNINHLAKENEAIS